MVNEETYEFHDVPEKEVKEALFRQRWYEFHPNSDEAHEHYRYIVTDILAAVWDSPLTSSQPVPTMGDLFSSDFDQLLEDALPAFASSRGATLAEVRRGYEACIDQIDRQLAHHYIYWDHFGQVFDVEMIDPFNGRQSNPIRLDECLLGVPSIRTTHRLRDKWLSYERVTVDAAGKKLKPEHTPFVLESAGTDTHATDYVLIRNQQAVALAELRDEKDKIRGLYVIDIFSPERRNYQCLMSVQDILKRAIRHIEERAIGHTVLLLRNIHPPVDSQDLSELMKVLRFRRGTDGWIFSDFRFDKRLIG